nr:MAG TPA: hypothetical protein [Caudoviricetes sp.]
MTVGRRDACASLFVISKFLPSCTSKCLTSTSEWCTLLSTGTKKRSNCPLTP